MWSEHLEEELLASQGHLSDFLHLAAAPLLFAGMAAGEPYCASGLFQLANLCAALAPQPRSNHGRPSMDSPSAIALPLLNRALSAQGAQAACTLVKQHGTRLRAHGKRPLTQLPAEGMHSEACKERTRACSCQAFSQAWVSPTLHTTTITTALICPPAQTQRCGGRTYPTYGLPSPPLAKQLI